MNKRIILNEKQAYLAMMYFLEEIYKRTKSDDIGGILGDMSINKLDNKTMDPAIWLDWIRAIEKARID